MERSNDDNEHAAVDPVDLVSTVLGQLTEDQRNAVTRYLDALNITPERRHDFLADVLGLIAVALEGTGEKT